MPNAVNYPRMPPLATPSAGGAARRPRCESGAVQQFAELVLDALPQPDGFPRRYEAMASPDGMHLVVQWQLPAKTIVPEAREVRYLPTKE